MKEYAAFVTLIAAYETAGIALFLFTELDIISIFFFGGLIALAVAGIFSWLFGI